MKLKELGYDWLAWVFFIVIPLMVFWQISTSLVEQDAASGGPLSNAAIFPQIVAWVMLGLAGVSAVQIVAGRVTTPSPIAATPTTKHALIATAIFLLYLFVLGPVGYYIATPVLIAALLRLFGLGWVPCLVGAAVMTLTVAGLFEGLLNVVLPLGHLKFTLFG